MRKNLYTLVLFLFNIAAFAGPTVIYIKQGGSTTADGLSWENAVSYNRGRSLVNFYNNQNPAVETQIWAKSGTYSLTADAFQLTIPIKMYGGFNGTETTLAQRNWRANPTILTQTVSGKGVIFNNAELDVLLDGWTLQNGNKSIAGSCGSLFPGATLRNCIIQNNITSGSAVFQLNGVAGSTKKFVFENCLIVNNESGIESAAFLITANAQVDIINCTIANNLVSTPGNAHTFAINASAGVVLNVRNSIIYGNRVGNQLAACVSSIAATKNLNNNAWDMEATSGTLNNNIQLKATPFVSTSPFVGVANGTDKIFNAITGSDFSLKASSGCVNKGNNAFTSTINDLGGNLRILNDIVDIGCFESSYTAYPTITPNHVLQVDNGIYYLDGEPFAEIGWNKFDICWLFWDELNAGRQLTETNAMVVKQRNSIRELSEAGIKTIRLFGCVHSSKFDSWIAAFNDTLNHEKSWLPLDKTLDICEQYNIRAIVSLMCENFVDRSTTENIRELVADSLSASRTLLYKYIDEAMIRYKDRKGVLAWEVSNEMTNKADIMPGSRINSDGERLPTMAQLSQFYKQVGRRVKAIDTLRMITSGGSFIREMAYGLSVIPQSATATAWPTNRDTYTQYKNMYKLVYDNSEFENVDIHFYMRKAPNYQIRANDGSDFMMNEVRFNTLSTAIGKPLMLGEYGALPKEKTDPNYWLTGHDWFETFTGESDSAQMYVQDACDRAVNSGCRLIYWWCYDSHRPMDQTDPQRMDLDVERTPILFQKVIDANNRLKQKYNITTVNTVNQEIKQNIWFSGGCLNFSPELYGKICYVYNTHGMIVSQLTVDSRVPITIHKKGIYIVRVEDKTLKILSI